jgi:hypothetical protein
MMMLNDELVVFERIRTLSRLEAKPPAKLHVNLPAVLPANLQADLPPPKNSAPS